MPHFLVIGIAVLAFTALLLIGGRSRAKTVKGVQWLKHGAALRTTGAFGLVMSLYVIVDNLNADRPYTAFILGFVFTAIALPVFLLAYFWRVGYDVNGVYCVSPWRKNRFVPWSQIIEVSFSQAMKQWIVHTDQLGTVRINVLVPGSDQLLDELARRGIKMDRRRHP